MCLCVSLLSAAVCLCVCVLCVVCCVLCVCVSAVCLLYLSTEYVQYACLCDCCCVSVCVSLSVCVGEEILLHTAERKSGTHRRTKMPLADDENRESTQTLKISFSSVSR